MSQYVTIEQYCARKGIDPNTVVGVAAAKLDSLLVDASNLVDVTVRPYVINPVDVAEDGDLGALIPIIIQMVARISRNPDGLTGEQLADYSWQSQGTVQATKLEKRIIRRIVGLPSASSMDMEQYVPIEPRYTGVLGE